MKKLLYFIAPALLFLSCTDMGHSPLKGKWQLKTVERDGIITSVDTVWYNFQSESLFSLQIYLVQQNKYIQPFGYRREQGNMLEVELISPDDLKYTDWTDVKRTFTVKKCKGDELILASEDNSIYKFDRF
jgi:hypothetical protein